MRNLKKFLALVLAMMMTFSLMVTVNAATADSDFTDASEITPEFLESVSVLEGLKVFTGYTNGDKFDFRPKNSITRAEVATIVYRLATGDVEGKQAHLYKDYATFTDVASDHWAAGYINYCANAEWIAGYGNGKFGPNDSVTGYQAAAMILRAVGYGKNKEFTGPSWQVQVANFTRSLGLLVNVNKTTYNNTLNQPAARELVAEILFQAGLIPVQKWTILNGYQDNGSPLAIDNFGLAVSGWKTLDKWGNPGYQWTSNGTVVATVYANPALEFDTVMKECDVAEALKIKTSDTFVLYVNRYTPITDKYLIESTDTVTSVGGQGRETKFYKEEAHPWSGKLDLDNNGTLDTFAKLGARVTMVDTYLATVTKVTERVLDRNGHVIVPAYLYLDVYDGHGVGPANSDINDFYAKGSAAKCNTSQHRLSNKAENYTYTVGEKLLVKGYTDYEQWEYPENATGTVTSTIGSTGLNHWSVEGATPKVTVESQAAKEKAAFEPNCLMPAGIPGDLYKYDDLEFKLTDSGTASVALEVAGKATVKTGKQTVTYWNQAKHSTDIGNFDDANTLYLDVAGTKTGTTFAWCFDLKGNLIGIDNVPNTVNYGVITSIYSAFNQGDNATTGTAKAMASVLYADGTTGTITIDRFLVSDTATLAGHATAGTTMTAGAGSADLVPVYDYTGANVMNASSRGGTPTLAATNGYLHVAPVAAVNANAENNQNGSTYYGVLRGNLFKFVASNDGAMTAIEVAGDGSNTGNYAGHYNAGAVVAGGKLYKNLGYIDTDNVPGTTEVRLDNDAKVMIRATGTSTAVACYDMTTLPGDVTLEAGSEVDWVDTDGDNRAEYVYVTGTGVGTLTYGLFYYNGGAAVWDGANKTGTLTGWLNGDPATLTFIGENTFNKVRDSQSYTGHLFAVQMTNGVVTALLQNAGNEYLLNAVATALGTFDTSLFRNINGSNVYFVSGVTGSNPYDKNNSEAIYLNDVTGTPAAGQQNVLYNVDRKTVIDTTNGVTYYLTDNSKVVGLGMGVSEDGAILDYLNKSTTNDVTIVYDKNSKSIVEIYVATDPNVTPSDDPTVSTIYTPTLSIDGSGNISLAISSSNAADTSSFTARIYSYSVTNPWGITPIQVDTVTSALAAGAYAATPTAISGANNTMYFYAVVTINGQTVQSNTILGNQ